MATIRKRGDKYHAQIRKLGYPSITQSFSSLTTAKRWVSVAEADMERHLHVVIPDNTLLGELLERYESPPTLLATSQSSKKSLSTK